MALYRLLALVVLLIPVNIFAQTAEQISFIEDKVLNFKEIDADFTMIRTVPMIKGQQVTKGYMKVLGDDGFEWHVTEGDRYDVVASDGTVIVTAGGKETVTDMESSPVYSRVMKMTEIFSKRPFYRDSRSFRTAVSSCGEGLVSVETIPLRSGMSAFFSKISVVARESDGAVTEVNLFAPNGAVTRIVFDDVKVIR